MNQSPAIFSFFSGTGFLDLGFELSGYKIAFVNEIFLPFIKAYRYSRNNLSLPEAEYGYENIDVREYLTIANKKKLNNLIKDVRQYHKLVGFIGGPPCPDFSIGGKNRGEEGDKGKLSATFIEIICEQKPDFFLFENVKGLWQTKKHREFYEELKIKLSQSGYVLTEQLINAIEYGVPQDRERIILLGFLSDLLPQNFAPKKISNLIFPWNNYRKYSKESIFNLPWPKVNKFAENSDLPCPNLIPELTVEYWFQKNDVLNHPNAKHHFQPRAGIKRFSSIDEGDDSRKSFKRLHRWRYSPTACYGNNEVHLHPYKIRRISAAESLALQSLPKEYSLPEDMTLTNMFKTIGNGVPFLASVGIANSILHFLENISKNSPELVWNSNEKIIETPKQLELDFIFN